jgi:hypothetical protein
MRWMLLAAIAIVGCGGAVSDEGAVDESGCPVRAEDWAGTATLSSGCSGAPATLQVSGGQYADGSGNPNGPSITNGGVQDGMCIAIVGADVACGRASYLLKVPAR